MGFIPSFSALFSGGLVEQCIAIVQNNQAAAIAAYADDPFPPQFGGVLDAIAELVIDWRDRKRLRAPGDNHFNGRNA